MPEAHTKRRAARKKSPGSKAGAYVREEIQHVREGKHGARSAKQAIAIGLSKARRAGVKLPSPPGKKATKASHTRPSAKRSRATSRALKRAGSEAASPRALSAHARQSARTRGHANLTRAAKKASRTKGAAGRSAAARKAARTRAAA